MNAKEAADRLRPHFHLETVPPEERHHIEFVERVADELGVEKTAFNLAQVAEALDAADIHGETQKFPMMLYSRTHHAVDGIAASVYMPRHDAVAVHVESDEQAKALGDGWHEHLDHLPPRGEIPLHAPKHAKPAVMDNDTDVA